MPITWGNQLNDSLNIEDRILGTTFLIPHLGARKFFILLISGQIIMAIVVSHFGNLESPKDPISMKKVIGASIVVIGAFLSTS